MRNVLPMYVLFVFQPGGAGGVAYQTPYTASEQTLATGIGVIDNTL